MTDPKPLSEMELVELERLVDKATPGPWKSRKSVHGNKYRYVSFSTKADEMYTTSELDPHDARYIAAIHPDIIKRLISMARK